MSVESRSGARAVWVQRLLLAFVAALWLVGPLAPLAGAEEPADRLEQLEAEVEELRRELARASGPQEDDRLAEIERRIEVLASEIERLQLGEAAAEADRGQHGLGPAASKVYRTERGVSIGGYGEMLFEAFASEREDGSEADKNNRLDFLRFVLYLGYKFSERWLLNSEVELEHASTGEGGSVSVEFAYLDYLWRPELNLRFGLVLLPMGFINELHEPTVFLGARRPLTERAIIPTTWRENGFGLYGETGLASFRAFVVNGLDASGFDASGLRGGRQKGSKALADDFAWVGRLDLEPRVGTQFGGSLYVGNSGQGLEDSSGRELGVLTTILEGHATWRWRALEVKALGSWAWLDDVAALNDALGLEGRESVGEKLVGGYIQGAYDLASHWTEGGPASLTPYLRWELTNTQDRVPSGFESDPARDTRIWTLGVALKPIEQIIFKADYEKVSNKADTGLDQFNVALGFIF